MSTENTKQLERIRQDFPILSQTIKGNPLVYLDNAATSQKPVQMINKITDYYTRYNSNIHRAAHHLSQLATGEYESAREKARGFINAKHSHEILFTSGTTESVNLVAYSMARSLLEAGDEVLISEMEHHSNIVPWQIICEEKGAVVKTIPYDENGQLLMEGLEKRINNRTKLVSVVHISNSLGSINDIKAITTLAHASGVPVLVDGAQAVPHMPIDVQALDCDLYAFSGHKMLGPTGIGVLYGKEDMLNKLPPYKGGGEMIKKVTFEKTTFNDLPYKFEAGTPNIAGAIALGAAIDYINDLGWAFITEQEAALLDYGTEKLSAIDGLNIIGNAQPKASVISFSIDGLHPSDVGTILDQLGIAVRTGHHCTQPIMDHFQIPGTIRASFAFYNTFEEIDSLVKGLEKAIKMLS